MGEGIPLKLVIPLKIQKHFTHFYHISIRYASENWAGINMYS